MEGLNSSSPKHGKRAVSDNMDELELDSNRRERGPTYRQDEEAHSGQERIKGHNPSLGPDPFGRRAENVGNRSDVDTP